MENKFGGEIARRHGIGWRKLHEINAAQKKAAANQPKTTEANTNSFPDFDPNNLSFWVTLTFLAIAAMIAYTDYQQLQNLPDWHYVPNTKQADLNLSAKPIFP